MKDWVGNNKSIFVCNGASNHSNSERQSDDYYATEIVTEYFESSELPTAEDYINQAKED